MKKFGAAILLAATAATSAQAVNFNLVDTGGTAAGTRARFGFEVAAAYWSSVLTDDITVNLDIGFAPLGPNILGSTGSRTGSKLVQNAYIDLFNDATTAADVRAVTNLKGLTASDTVPGLFTLDVITNDYVDPVNRIGVDTKTKSLDSDGSPNNYVLDANTATLKALGNTIDDDGLDIVNGADGSITFSSEFAFDFNPNDGIRDGQIDFISVAIHEIGHALGFVSGVDTYDVVGRDNGPLAGLFESGAFGSADIGEFRVGSLLDLYRYSEDGLDWSVGTDAFFSLDGKNQLFGSSLMSTGSFNGDGRQASHWIDNIYAPRTNPNCSNVVTPATGIMNPTIGNCEAGFITALDLAAFDAMGWDVNIDVLSNPGYTFTTRDAYLSFVPEPGSWALMIAGFGMVGAAARRRHGYATA